MAEDNERRIGDLTVTVDRDSCISSGNCIKLAPELFDFDDQTLPVFTPGAGQVDREKVLEACRVCPVEALTVKDSSGKQIVP